MNEVYECCNCGHEYSHAQAKRLPDPEWNKSKLLACPKCDCLEFYISEVEDD